MSSDVPTTEWEQPPIEKASNPAAGVLDTNLYSYTLYYVDGTTCSLYNCDEDPKAMRKAIREGGGYYVGKNVLINASTVMRWHLTETYTQRK